MTAPAHKAPSVPSPPSAHHLALPISGGKNRQPEALLPSALKLRHRSLHLPDSTSPAQPPGTSHTTFGLAEKVCALLTEGLPSPRREPNQRDNTAARLPGQPRCQLRAEITVHFQLKAISYYKAERQPTILKVT